MVSAGTLIWISLRPLLRFLIAVAGGFAITKADIFPAVAARGAAQIALNITIPSLMFSKIVPAFTSENIGALGPLILICVIYQALGIGIAWLTKQVFWVPHRFRYGILVAGGWANYGDIPIAVITSITSAAPFNGSSDQDLSVAYISAFILFYLVTFFPMGGNKWIAWDFEGPDVEPDEVREATRQRRRFLLRGWPTALARRCMGQRVECPQSAVEKQEDKATDVEKVVEAGSSDIRQRPRHGRHVSFYEDVSTAVSTNGPSPPPTEKLHSPAPTVQSSSQTAAPRDHDTPVSRPLTPVDEAASAEPVLLSPMRRRWNATLATVKRTLWALCTPPSISIIVSFPIALVTPLKALFVEVDGYYMPPAPDGQPPLAFIYDFSNFMGAASVPIGLICLGSALARLNVPRSEWPNLPLGAILSLAVGRMLLMPVLGVVICEGLTLINVIARDDKVLQFVCIFFSCLPTATTQVFVTQVYSGTGSAEHLSAFLIPQYILMFLSMTALSAYTLQMLF
ncbi:auxin efflux carrier [Hymenopellis radicata]|nr:auxin efflux carrier [Hymenopellis radicata]